MLPTKKLSDLKNLAKDLKFEIQQHHNLSPLDGDDAVNSELFVFLGAVLDKIEIIEKNNNVTL